MLWPRQGGKPAAPHGQQGPSGPGPSLLPRRSVPHHTALAGRMWGPQLLGLTAAGASAEARRGRAANGRRGGASCGTSGRRWRAGGGECGRACAAWLEGAALRPQQRGADGEQGAPQTSRGPGGGLSCPRLPPYHGVREASELLAPWAWERPRLPWRVCDTSRLRGAWLLERLRGPQTPRSVEGLGSSTASQP